MIILFFNQITVGLDQLSVYLHRLNRYVIPGYKVRSRAIKHGHRATYTEKHLPEDGLHVSNAPKPTTVPNDGGFVLLLRLFNVPAMMPIHKTFAVTAPTIVL